MSSTLCCPVHALYTKRCRVLASSSLSSICTRFFRKPVERCSSTIDAEKLAMIGERVGKYPRYYRLPVTRISKRDSRRWWWIWNAIRGLGLSWTIAGVDLDNAFLPMEYLGVGLFLYEGATICYTNPNASCNYRISLCFDFQHFVDHCVSFALYFVPRELVDQTASSLFSRTIDPRCDSNFYEICICMCVCIYLFIS